MISFQVNDMSCNHCVRSITQAVASLDANAELQFDLGQHQVHIAGASADGAQLAAAIQAAGFTPVPLQLPVAGAGPASTPARKGCCCG